MIENLPLMLEKLSEAKKPDEVRNYLLPLLGRALSQEKQSNLQAKSLEVRVRKSWKIKNLMIFLKWLFLKNGY